MIPISFAITLAFLHSQVRVPFHIFSFGLWINALDPILHLHCKKTLLPYQNLIQESKNRKPHNRSNVHPKCWWNSPTNKTQERLRRPNCYIVREFIEACLWVPWDNNAAELRSSIASEQCIALYKESIKQGKKAKRHNFKYPSIPSSFETYHCKREDIQERS
jgi:hypothetical protein